MTQADEINSATGRHWMYGLNVGLLAVIGLVIVGFLLYITSVHHWRHDFTSGGMFSLSESTRKLVGEIDQKKQQYELINLMRSDADQYNQVNDLLTEYTRLSKNMTASDSTTRAYDEVANKIKARYEGETKPFQVAVEEFPKLAKELREFSKTEAANFGGLAQAPGMSPEAKEEAANYQGFFTESLPQAIAAMERSIQRASESELPEWGTVVGNLRKFLKAQEILELGALASTETTKSAFEPAVHKYTESAQPRYVALLAKVAAYDERLSKLGELKSQSLLKTLTPNTVVVLGPTSAKVISAQDMFKEQGPVEEGGKSQSTFEGEQAVSSALLSMVRTEKIKVVYVSPTPQRLMQGPMSMVTKSLRDANFEVLEWSPSGAPQMNPDAPAQTTEPPAIGKGVVWIVMPPDPMNMQMMMMNPNAAPNPGPVLEATKRHLKEGGQAMLLAEASAGNNPFAPPGGDKYGYDAVARSFGIEVKSNFTVVKNYQTQRGPIVAAEHRLTRFPNHAITKPLQAMPTVLAPMRSQSGLIGAPTVVGIAESKPADVTATVIMETEKDADSWGESAMSQTPKYEAGSDIKAPVPMAVAASREITIDGKTVSQRMVVVGCRVFEFNEYVDAGQDYLTPKGVVHIRDFPGNSELFLNSVLWLSGYENMIAVSSKTNAALRIRDIEPTSLSWIRWGILWLGGPAGALLLGVVVWSFRRR